MCHTRQPETSLQQYNVDFNQNYNKLRQHVTIITEDLLGFKLLKASNLTSHHKKRSNQSSPVFPSTKSEELIIKPEPLFYARELPAEDSGNEEQNDS